MPSPLVTPMRARQLVLVQAVVARLRGASGPSLPEWTLADLQLTGLATGLTALAGSLGLLDDTDPGCAEHVSEQRGQVAARVERFRSIAPGVLAALATADVLAVPVKGAVLCRAVPGGVAWPDPLTRPMSDIDLLVPVRYRAQATAALVRAGHRLYSSSGHEDTLLAWGDGSSGRTDGESVQHNGRIEVHPGWGEFLHGYIAPGFDLEQHVVRTADGQARLTDAAFATHVIGHLASTVVRAEVRAVNLLDVWFLHEAGLRWEAVGEVMTEVDPRLTAPGLWFVDRLLPGVVPAALLQRERERLRHPEVLQRASAAAVLRDPTERTTARWRAAFAHSAAERAAVATQMTQSVRRRVTARLPSRGASR